MVILKRLLGMARCAIFIAITVVSLFAINRVLEPKYTYANSYWPTTSTYNQFYEMEENSVDVLFLGSSVCVNAFSPQEIYNEYGIRSYNLGCEQQSVLISYHWLKEALKYQSPAAVVMDTRFLFTQHDTPTNSLENITRKAIDPMRLSENKLEAAKTICELDGSQDFLSYVFSNLRFHTRWTQVTEQDLVFSEFKTAQLKGFSAITEYGPAPEEYPLYTPGGSLEVASPNPLMSTYMDKIVDLCKENHIALILVTIPGNDMDDSINNYLTTYAQTNNIDYINFSETNQFMALGAQLPRDNVIFHMNLWGSIKMSRYMGRLLLDKYKIPSVTDPQYEDTKDFYENTKTACELPHIEDFEEYLKTLEGRDFTVFFSALPTMVPGDETPLEFSPKTLAALNRLGLATNIEPGSNCYVAMVSPEGPPVEAAGKEEAAIKGSFRNDHSTFKVTSTYSIYVAKPSIFIDSMEYSPLKAGINVVVYDNKRNSFIERRTFDLK